MRGRSLLLLSLFTFLAFPALNVAATDVKDAPGPLQITRDGEKWVEKMLKGLSLEEKIGQLIMVKAHAEFQNVESPEYKQLRDQIQKLHIGSVIITVRTDGPFLLRNQPYEAAIVLNRLQKESKHPLLVAADFERGLSMRLLATPIFPHAMAFAATGDPEYAERFGAVTAREGRAIGVHWNFFPVADVNNNPQNPIINTRSYGEDPQQVGDLLAAYIRGARGAGMLTTAKHFPGHGDTDTDSHLAVARVNVSIERLRAVELPPFQRAIDAGVDSIMVAHVAMPAVEPDPNKVATISSRAITDLLKNEMKFQGLVVTDAMDMKGLTSIYTGEPREAAGRAAVDALLAGNDMILLPSDVEGAYTGMLAAAQSGVITGEMLEERVRKVLRAKAMLGLHKRKEADLELIERLVGRPDDVALGQQVAEAAVTLVRNENQALALLAAEKQRGQGTATAPLAYEATGVAAAPVNGTAVIIFTDDVRSEWGRAFEREVRARVRDARVIFIDRRFAPAMLEPVTEAVVTAKAVIVAAFSIPVSFSRLQGMGLQKDVNSVLDRIMRIAPEKTAVVALGNPYLAKDVAGMKTYLCTFSHVASSEVAAVKALFGEIPMRGKLPVTIPGYAQRGAGIERAATQSAALARP